MKTNFHGGGPFDPPSGQITVETPDGVVKTYGSGETRTNILSGTFVHGGFDGCAYGAFRDDDMAYEPPTPPGRIRVR